MATIFVYILLLKYRTHEIIQMEVTVRIRSFPELFIVLKVIDRLTASSLIIKLVKELL